MARWWGHFAAFIGTVVLVLVAYGWATKRQVTVRNEVVVAIFVVAVLYAFVRRGSAAARDSRRE